MFEKTYLFWNDRLSLSLYETGIENELQKTKKRVFKFGGFAQGNFL